MRLKAQIEIECENPETIIKSIAPDMTKTEKFDIKFEPAGNKLKISVEADEISALLAGINSYMRLVKTAIAVSEVD